MNKSNKYLFLIPIVTLIMWTIGAVLHLTEKSNSFAINRSIENRFSKEDSHFENTKVAKNDFVISEFEPEFEFEWSALEVIYYDTPFFIHQKQLARVIKHNAPSPGVVPLYDLFCKWKFHLS